MVNCKLCTIKHFRAPPTFAVHACTHMDTSIHNMYTQLHTCTHTHRPALLGKHATTEASALENAGMQNVVWESQYLIQASKYDARASGVQ